MNPLLETLQANKASILKIAEKYGASNIRVFGSVARGDTSLESNIDFLVDLEPERSLLDQIGLMQDLEELLGRSVDVVETVALHERLREQVLKDAIAL